jgi:hypothetical protein
LNQTHFDVPFAIVTPVPEEALTTMLWPPDVAFVMLYVMLAEGSIRFRVAVKATKLVTLQTTQEVLGKTTV